MINYKNWLRAGEDHKKMDLDQKSRSFLRSMSKINMSKDHWHLSRSLARSKIIFRNMLQLLKITLSMAKYVRRAITSLINLILLLIHKNIRVVLDVKYPKCPFNPP